MEEKKEIKLTAEEVDILRGLIKESGDAYMAKETLAYYLDQYGFGWDKDPKLLEKYSIMRAKDDSILNGLRKKLNQVGDELYG